MDLSTQRLLVISPHPDDETYGCAGTIAKIKDRGGEVYVIVVALADLPHYVPGGMEPVTATTRTRELDDVMRFLKVDDYEVLFTDPERLLRLDALPRRELVELFERECRLAINKLKPTIVALPAPSYNQDHVAVFEAGFTACRPHLPDYKHAPGVVVTYDNPTLSWYHQHFHPTLYVDISEYLDTKIEAFRRHRSQIKSARHFGSLESMVDIARVKGREIAVDAAEAFVCYRMVL